MVLITLYLRRKCSTLETATSETSNKPEGLPTCLKLFCINTRLEGESTALMNVNEALSIHKLHEHSYNPTTSLVKGHETLCQNMASIRRRETYLKRMNSDIWLNWFHVKFSNKENLPANRFFSKWPPCKIGKKRFRTTLLPPAFPSNCTKLLHIKFNAYMPLMELTSFAIDGVGKLQNVMQLTKLENYKC